MGRSTLDGVRHRLGQSRVGKRTVGSLHGAFTREPYFAVTFDDGPDPRVTPRVLDALDLQHASATFFMRADRAIEHPVLAREVAARGHEVGVHGFEHERMTELGLAGIRRETTLARRELRRILGTNPRWFRPPFGAQNIRTFLATRLQGMDIAVWATDISDAMSTEGIEVGPGPAGSLTLRAMGVDVHYAPGNILLLHDTPAADDPSDGAARKIAMIERILQAISSVGGRCVTLSELLGCGPADRRVWRSPGY